MSTLGTPPPQSQRIEPTTWFIVIYYPNNQTNTDQTQMSPLMQNYNDALALAKTYIANAGNIGVCAISQVTGTIVYPSTPWQDW